MPSTIRVSAVVMHDEDGLVLNVRKRGTHMLMLPGGKPEPGEDARDTAMREFSEELGVSLNGLLLRSLGEFTAPAANEPGHEVIASVFSHPYVEAIASASPQSEIEHIEWVDPLTSRADMAPLNTEVLFPLITRIDAPYNVSRIAVFTGSSPGTDEAFATSAAELALACAARGTGIVYGGGHVGLMGTVADACIAAGGEVICVIPQSLVDSELAHTTISRLEVVADMHTRKHRMASLSDAFVALPGGLGTLEELFEVWTWSNLGLHNRPVALYDVNDFWRPLIDMIDAMVAQGFVAQHHRDALIIASSPTDLFEQLATWKAPQRKWSEE